VPSGAAPADLSSTIRCDGTMTSNVVQADGPSVLRLALPGSASWRLVVRVADGRLIAPAATAARPVPGAGEDVLVDASSADARPTPSASQASGPFGGGIQVGQLKFRDRYVFQASCVGPPAIAYGTTFSDPADPTLPESTTLVPCDGAVHETIMRPGDRPDPDVIVMAPDGASWRLLVTADPTPIANAPDEPGWSGVISSGPRFDADDVDQTLVGRTTGGSTLARVVVSCQGPGFVDVLVSRGDQTGTMQTFTAPCGDQASTLVGEPFSPDENGEFSVEADPHGRMWTAITVQQANPASAAP
jgi:hypothetical protein